MNQKWILTTRQNNVHKLNKEKSEEDRSLHMELQKQSQDLSDMFETAQ